MMKILKRIWNFTTGILVLLVIVLAILLIGVRLVGIQPYTVLSGSMEPEYHVGSMIYVISVDPTSLQVRDPVTFYLDGSTVATHRVIEVEEINGIKCYTTKGDNPAVGIDPGFRTDNDIVAVYKFRIPAVGRVIDFLKKPVGFVLFLVLPLLAIIGWQVYKLVVIYMEAKREKILEEAKDGMSEEAKEAIIKEFLMKQQAELEAKKQTEAANQAETVENDAGEEK